MRVKLMSWAQWAGNASNGTASCRVCEKTIRGLDFYEAEQLDAKGRRFICAGCVKEQGAEVVADFGPLVEGPVVSRPMSEMLPSHRKVIQGLVLAAITAHERKFHADIIVQTCASKQEAEEVDGQIRDGRRVVACYQAGPEAPEPKASKAKGKGETVSGNANAK